MALKTEIVPIRLLGITIRLLIAALMVFSCSQEKKRVMVQKEPVHASPSPVLIQPSNGEKGVDTYSNIRREDYVGPQVCGDCHPKNYDSWKKHPHSRMNMPANGQTVLGDFSGTSVFYHGQRVMFEKQDSTFFVSYYQGEKQIRKFRVTRVIGWRYEQDYVGVQIAGPEPPDDLLYTEETRLRFSYLLDRKRWFPQSYLEPKDFPGSEYLDNGQLRHDPFEPERLAFNKRCAVCHNTYPYDLRLYKILTPDGMLSGFPPGPHVGPKEVETLAQEHGDLALMQDKTLPLDRLVTIGISCESCHFGGREHAFHNKDIRFVPTHPQLAGWTPDHKNARKNPAVINAICRQCHHSGSAKDNWPDGSATLNSMEAVEMDRGECQNAIRCTHCHNTHIGGPPAGAPDRKEHIAACVTCHTNLQSETSVQAHSQHGPNQALCLDCHMPRIVQGFGGYNRTHRISSPTDPKILGTGMPNACNLCHLDKSLAWTRDMLEKKWGKRVDLSPSLKPLFGQTFDKPAGEAWFSHSFPAVQLVTAGAYARSPLGQKKLPDLLKLLNEPNANMRLQYLESVERVLGRKLRDSEYDLMGSPSEREKQVRQLITRYNRQ